MTDKSLSQNLARELSISPNIQLIQSTALMSGTSANVPLPARVYLKLGAWKWTLTPGLDDDSIQGNYKKLTFFIFCILSSITWLVEAEKKTLFMGS